MRKYVASALGGLITYSGRFAVAFIVLRLTDVITWPWWRVLAPVWIPAAIIIGAYAALRWRDES